MYFQRTEALQMVLVCKILLYNIDKRAQQQGNL